MLSRLSLTILLIIIEVLESVLMIPVIGHTSSMAMKNTYRKVASDVCGFSPQKILVSSFVRNIRTINEIEWLSIN